MGHEEPYGRCTAFTKALCGGNGGSCGIKFIFSDDDVAPFEIFCFAGHRSVSTKFSVHSVEEILVVHRCYPAVHATFGSGNHVRADCFGKRKVEMLIQRGYPPPWPYVYTDSLVDLPILRRAESSFLINPTPRAVERARRALDRPPTVLRWE